MGQLRVWGALFVGSALAAGCGGGGAASPANRTEHDAAPESIDVASDRADAGPDRADAPPDPSDTGTQVRRDTAVSWEGGVDCNPGLLPPSPAGLLTQEQSIAPNEVLACESQAFWCGASACGNGVVDSCDVAVRACGQAPIKTVVESCDGVALNGASCQSLGYAGGTLGCTSLCGYDVRRCTTCTAAGSPSANGSCAPSAVTVTGNPFTVALAAGPSELGMAWVARRSDGTSSIGFARLDAALAVISQTPDIDGQDQSPAYRVSVVPLAGGWEVLVQQERGIKLILMDATGRPTGATRLLPDIHDAAAVAPPGGPPLVTWIEAVPQDFDAGVPQPQVLVDAGVTYTIPPYLGPVPATRAALLLSDGVTMSTPLTLFAGSDGDRSAAFVGDGFLVAERTRTGIQTARVESDGSSASPAKLLLAPDRYEFPLLASAGGLTRLLYMDFAGTRSTFAVTLDRTGAMVGAPSLIAADLVVFQALLFQPLSVVLRAGESGIDQHAPFLDLLRLDGDGNPGGAPVRMVTDPMGAQAYRLVRFGSDAVVAWITGGCPGGVQLARVTP